MAGAALVVAVLFGGAPHFGRPVWLPEGLGAPPQPQHDQAPPPSLPPVPPQSHGSVWPLILLGIVVLAAAVAFWLVLRALLRARQAPPRLPLDGAAEPTPPPLPTDASADDEPEPDAPTVHRGLRRALDELDAPREPGDAIVTAWLGLQAAAEDSGVERRPAETPTEFTRRVITRVQADERAAEQLVEVYQGVRFGAHPITSADVRAARSAVERMLDSWHEPILRSRR